MTATTSRATQLAVLSATTLTSVSYQQFSTSSAIPDNTEGVSVPDTVVLMLGIALREDAQKFSSRVQVITADYTATYTVTVGGNSVSFDAAAQGATTVADILNGLATAAQGSAPIAALADVYTVAKDGSATINELVFKSNVSATSTHTTLVSATNAGVLTFKEDCESLDFTIWGKLKDGDFPYVMIKEAEFPVPNSGWVERLEVNMFDKIYVQTSNIVSPSGNGSDGKIGFFLGEA